MLANKFIQKLIIINGLLFPLIPILLLFLFAKSTFLDSRPEDTPYVEGDGVIVGDKLEKANAEKLALQGLYMRNDVPEKVFNSKNFYVKLYLNTYEQAKQFEDLASSAGDINPFSFLNDCNVLFLGENYEFKSLLLNKKANISDITMPTNYIEIKVNEKEVKQIPDSTIKNIAYLIGFEDTNQDNLINRDDAHDLFISDLNGQNLIQVSQNMDINRYHFQNDHSEIFLFYRDRTNEREEHKRNKFAIYDIKTKTLKKPTDIDKALDDFEKVLRQ